MEFSFISIFAIMLDTLIIIPEMVHTIKGVRKIYRGSAVVTVLDYLLKYFCIVLMFLPLGINKFGFLSIFGMLVYVIGNSILTIAYDILFIINVKKDSYKADIRLSIVMIAIFIISGLVLRHYILLISTVVYSIVHYYYLKGISDQYNAS